MAYFKPSNPLKMDENYIYPLTTYDQVILPDGSRWTGKALENGGSINGNLNINGVVEAQSFVENGVFLASKYAQVATYNVILDKNNWSEEAPYIQSVSVPGILASDIPIVDVDLSDAATSTDGEDIISAWNMIGRISAETSKITAYCYSEKPSINLKLIFKVMR